MSKEFPVSQSVGKMHASSTFKAMQAAAALRERGVDVIDLTLGEPDFPTPQFIKDLAIEGLNRGVTKYTPTAGLKSFTESIAHFYAQRFGADIAPSEIAATCGGKQALFNSICSLVGPGDDVLIAKPYWVTFPEIVNFTGAGIVYIETEETGFILNAEQVKAAITPRTKLLIVNSPSNPSGRVVPADEMRRIIEVCAEKGVYVVTDECYLFFVYPPSEVFTGATLPREMREFVCVAGSFSKTYAMTGWRIGYTIAPAGWTREMLKLQSHSASHPTSFVQYACARAMERVDESMAAVDSMLAEYKKRRDWLIPALNEVDGLKCPTPEGAFYAFFDVRGLIGERFNSSAEVADHLLGDAHTVLTDGAGFGADGYLRLSYATSIENLEKAVERIKKSLN
jgi:aspartate aminotransferase